MFPFTPMINPQDRDRRFLYAIRRLKKRRQYTQLAPPSSVDEAPSTGGSSISGPDVSVDNAVVRWDGTDGDRIQSSTVFILDSGRVGIHKVTPGKALDIVSQGAGDGPRFRCQADTQDRWQVYTLGGGNGPARSRLFDGSGVVQVEFNTASESWLDGGNFHIKTPNRLKGGVTYSVTNEQVTGATANFVLTDRAWQDETVAAFTNQVDCCRTVTATCTNRDLGTNMTGTITVNMIDADSKAVADVITVNVPPGLPVTYTTDYAGFTITSIVVDKTDAHPIPPDPGADTYSIGVADEWGVPYPLNAAGDIFKATINGAHEIIASVNTTYGTFILTTAIITGDTIVGHFRPFR